MECLKIIRVVCSKNAMTRLGACFIDVYYREVNHSEKSVRDFVDFVVDFVVDL